LTLGRAAAGPGTYVPLVSDPLRLLVPAGHPLAGHPSVSLAEVADERWIQGWGDVGDVTDMLAALSGFRLQVACRSSDYRFMSALVGAGVGVALVPSLALTGTPDVRALQITPQLTRYIGAWLLGGTSQTQPPGNCSPHFALAPRPVREAGCGRGGDGRGAACCAGYPAQGAGLGGQERIGIGELQLTGVSGRAAPPRGCTACALRRG
jgi:LysR substrate binding domain